MTTKRGPAPEPEKPAAAADAAPAAAAETAATADAPEEAGPAAGETVWFETGTGQHEVAVGSQAYENLIAQGATRIEAPAETEEAKE